MVRFSPNAPPVISFEPSEDLHRPDTFVVGRVLEAVLRGQAFDEGDGLDRLIQGRVAPGAVGADLDEVAALCPCGEDLAQLRGRLQVVAGDKVGHQTRQAGRDVNSGKVTSLCELS